MSYSVKPGSILGRVGSEIGRGLSEQIPKLVERDMLSRGLANFEQESANLSPMQQLARLSAIPGITPQMIQSFGELGKQQAQRQGYGGAKGGAPSVTPAPTTQQFKQQASNINLTDGRQPSPTAGTTIPSEERGAPLGTEQTVPTGPTSPELQFMAPWTPEQRDKEINRVWDLPQNLNKSLPEIEKIVADNEARYMSMPEVAQKEYQRREKEFDDAKDRLHTDIKKKLEVETPGVSGVYKYITGENLAAIEREMDRYMTMNPKVSKNDAADLFSKKVLDLDKTKQGLKSIAGKGFFDRLTNGKSYYDSIKSYVDTFRESGNEEELWNILQTNNSPEKYGFGMSPQAAASVVYPPSKGVNEYISKSKPVTLDKQLESSKKHALEIEDRLTRNDSLLSIAKSLRDKDPFFDQNAFFNQLREDRAHLRLSDRQQRELDRGEQQERPTWGDFMLLPMHRWGKK